MKSHDLAIKLWECIIDKRLRDNVTILDGQVGLRPGVRTTDATLGIRTLCEKYRESDIPLEMEQSTKI